MFSKRVICYFIHVVVIYVHTLHIGAGLTTTQMSHSPRVETAIPGISWHWNADIILFHNSLTLMFACYGYICTYCCEADHTIHIKIHLQSAHKAP
jgi:hypothetical protein